MKSYLSLILIIIFSFISCDDIFETDISEEEVILLAPANNIVTNNLTITFWWEHVYQADDYILQVVSPDFAQIETLVLDTIIHDNKFEMALDTGNYEWSVKAINSISETAYFTFGFQIVNPSTKTDLFQ